MAISKESQRPARSALRIAALVWAIFVAGGFVWTRVVGSSSFARILHRGKR